MTQVTGDRLVVFLDGLDTHEDERKEVAAQVKALMEAAKAEGFDPKILKQVAKLRRMAEADREEQQELLDLYMGAVGMA